VRAKEALMSKRSIGKTAGIILAAGASSRMGRPKQLLDLGGLSLLDHVLKISLSSALDFIVLVLGSHSQEIRDGLKTDIHDPRLRIVENTDWKKGISSSIIRGMSEAQDRCDHCMVILADMPYITTELINDLLKRYLDSGLHLGAIQVDDRRSLPVIFGRALFKELMLLEGDVGARDLFRKYSGDVCLVKAGRDFHDADMDTPEDYRQIMRFPEGISDKGDQKGK
jgi:molybdenum cofactor cytidylyltransferase